MPLFPRIPTRKHATLALAAVLTAPLPVAAQETAVPAAPDTLPFPGELINRTYRGGDYLAPLLALREAEAAYLASAEWRPLFLDLASMQAAFAGEVAEAHRLFDLRRPPPPPREPAAGAFAGHTPLDAVDAVVEEAGRHRAVFVNEAHHVPQHRAFTIQLLDRLYALGYRWLAVEALSATDAGLHDRGYPIRNSGLYTDEPLMGDLVRLALRMGYRVVAYDLTEPVTPRADDPYFAPNERERMQAENLKARILDVDPEAKVLVHAGYGHVQEAPNGGWIPMAVRFREMTGIDPFTVDQTVMTERSAPEYEHPLYRVATAEPLPGARVFAADTGGYLVRGMSTDAQVFHPRTRMEHGRPAWMRLGGRRTPYAPAVPEGVQPPFLVQAFSAGEPDGATPVDQVVVREGRSATLFLPPGAFRVRVIDAAGSVVDEYTSEAGEQRLPPLE